jgi:hypothetical protein
MKKTMVLLAAAVMVFGLTVLAHADLTVIGTGTIGSSATNGTENMVNGGYQLIYDSAQNITWLDYTAANNRCQNQVNWANNLVVNFNGQNLTGWSLPTTVDNYNYSSGYNPPSNSSQMAYLFYTDLGNTANLDGYALNNVGPFKNLISANYWSAMSSSDPGFAWFFNTYYGYQYTKITGAFGFGLAVLPGDALDYVTPTPIPAAAYLFGSGLLGLIGIRKKMLK